MINWSIFSDKIRYVDSSTNGTPNLTIRPLQEKKHQHQVSLQGKHFPIHLDEARSVGLAKACVNQKIYSVPEKIS